jgi:hypothetical protein
MRNMEHGRDRMDYEMSDDHLLLTDILDEYDITVRQLALSIGRAAPTVYRYCSGESTIPSVVWRVLYEQTGDIRILKLITGSTNCVVVPLPDNPIRLDKPTIEHLHAERQNQLTCEKCVLDIMADGFVNNRDRPTIEKYNLAFPRMIQSLYQTHQSINTEYKQSCKRSKS